MKFEQDKKAKDGAPTGDIVDLASFRKKKEIGDELARGRKPLYVSHMTGKVTGSPHLKGNESADFGDRLQRIRASLDKINRLMTDLKKMSNGDGEGKDLLNSESGGTKKF